MLSAAAAGLRLLGLTELTRRARAGIARTAAAADTCARCSEQVSAGDDRCRRAAAQKLSSRRLFWPTRRSGPRGLQESSCPPLGVGDLRRSPSNAKAAISPNRAAIARRAEPRESQDSPHLPLNPRDVHSHSETVNTPNAESRTHHQTRGRRGALRRGPRRDHATIGTPPRRARRRPVHAADFGRGRPPAGRRLHWSPTPHPTPMPGASTYAPSPSCADDPTWSYGTKASNTCAYVARKLKRCKAKNTDGVRTALEACPVTCSTC